jgi:ferredoxin-nitrite reductase
MGDIGLLGTKVRGEDGYHVFVGGGFGKNQAIGRQIFSGVTATEISTMIEKMLRMYLRNRAGKESFLQFSTRHDLNTLQTFFSNEPDA